MRILRICGIVSEYNPFHNGHKFHIDKTREAGATHIVSVMSGNVVQRGETAIFDKHIRAKNAVKNGANLVIELPCPYSCASGELFALGAVEILKGLGCVDMLSFGCETDNKDLLLKTADCINELGESDELKTLLSAGESYPSALMKACEKEYGKEIAEVLKKPNNTLGIEYIKACKRLGFDVDFCLVKREGADHDSDKAKNGIASASFIREKILSGQDFSQLLPYECDAESFDFNVMTKAVVFKLKSMSFEDIIEIPDCTKELAVRICDYLKGNTPNTLSQLYDALKTKNITHARIRRVILYAMLGVRHSDFKIKPYARVLCADDKGMEILSEVKKKGDILISHSLARLSEGDEGAKRLSQLDVLSSQLQKMCSETEREYPNEFSVKFEKI